MNPKLVELREQKILPLLAEIEAIATNADSTADDYQRGKQLNEELEGYEIQYRELKALDDAAKRKADYDQPTPNGRISGIVPVDGAEFVELRDTRPLGVQFAEFAQNDDGFQAYAQQSWTGGNRRSPAFTFDGSLMEQRALIYGGALGADYTRPMLLPGIQRPNEPVGTRAMRDVLLSGTTTSDAITFLKENVFTNAAVPVIEATSVSTGGKPESSLTFTQATAPVEIIAHWIPITRNAIDDVPQLQSYVEGRLLDGLVREENDQLINGDGTAPNISGILDQSGIQNLDQTYFTGAAVQNPGAGGPENYNRILRAKTLIMTTGDSSASFVAMHPTDWETLLTLADTTDQYFGLGPFGAGTPERIWNLEVVLTEDKAAGSVLVGDGTAAQVFDRMSAQIFVADQHSDFFIRNMFVLLAEERLGLAVYRPAAFALTDLV